jgi:hypothetical protein
MCWSQAVLTKLLEAGAAAAAAAAGPQAHQEAQCQLCWQHKKALLWLVHNLLC